MGVKLNKAELKKKEELDLLLQSSLDIDAQILEETSTRDRVEQDNDQKASVLKRSKRNLEKMKEKQNKELGNREIKNEEVRDSRSEELNLFRAQVNDLKVSISSYDVVEHENNLLRIRVNEKRKEQETATNRNTIAISHLRKEMFSSRMKIEMTYRDAKKKWNNEYNNKAIDEMDNESNSALQQNITLLDTLNANKMKILLQIKAHQKIESELTNVRIEKSLTDQFVNYQESEIITLSKNNEHQKSVLAKRHIVIANLHEDLGKLKRNEKLVLDAMEEIEKFRAWCDVEERKCKKFEGVVLSMIEDIDVWISLGGGADNNAVEEGASDDVESEGEEDMSYIWRASRERLPNVVPRRKGGGDDGDYSGAVDSNSKKKGSRRRRGQDIY